MTSRRPGRGTAVRVPRPLVLLVLAAASILRPDPTTGQTVSRDGYTHRGSPVAITIHLDSIGVWPGNGVDPTRLQGALAGLDLRRERALPEGIVLFSLPQPVSRDSIHALARAVEQRLANGKSGPLARLERVPSLPWALTDELLVRPAAGVPPARIDSLARVLGAELVSVDSIPPASAVIRVPREAGDVLDVARRFEASALVAAVHPNMLGGAASAHGPASAGMAPRGGAIDPHYPLQWHLNNTNDADIDAPEAWAIETGDPAIPIAIIELTGLDSDHPDLAGNLWNNPLETVDGVDNDGDGHIDDLHGCVIGNPAGCDLTAKRDYHGTAVAGLAAATGDNGMGVKGVCPGCSLMLITTWTPALANKVGAFKYAALHGARVINTSWSMFRFTDLEDAVLAVAAADIAVVASIGNDDDDYCTGDWLVGLPEVLAVGASSNTDTRLTAGHGPCLDVLAPGGAGSQLWGITTTDSPGNRGYNTGFATFLDPWNSLAEKQLDCTFAGSEIADPDYTRCFGATSAAAPITAGVAGLLLSRNPGLTRQQVYDVITGTADKIDAAACAYSSGFSTLCGWGRVNAFAALDEDSDSKKIATAAGIEVGVRIGLTHTTNGTDRTTLSLPAGGPRGVPVLHVARVTASSHLELQFGFRRDQDSGSAGDVTEAVLAFQPSLFLAGNLYAGPNVAVHLLDTASASSTEAGYGGALGIRWLPGSSISLRLEARYRFWPGPSLHETGLALAAGVIL